MKYLHYANNLRRYRVREGFTQSQVARAMSVSKNTISSIECAGSCPSLYLAFKLSWFFQVPLDQLFYFDSFDQDNVPDIDFLDPPF